MKRDSLTSCGLYHSLMIAEVELIKVAWCYGIMMVRQALTALVIAPDSPSRALPVASHINRPMTRLYGNKRAHKVRHRKPYYALITATKLADQLLMR